MPWRLISPTPRRGLGALLAVLMLAGCEPGSPPRARSGPTPAGPTKGGAVTFGVLGAPASLDPYARVASDLSYFLARPVYRSLYRVGPDGVVEADLASSLEPAGRRGVVVTIESAAWSNGRPVTARDVVRSARRARPPSGFAGLGAEVVGRHRIRFEGRVEGDWARRLALGTYVLPGGRAGRAGAGPFTITSYVPGLQLVYGTNESWVGEEPLLDRLRVQFVAHVDLLLRLLERGELDAAAIPSSVNITDRLDELGLRAATSPGWETISLAFAPGTGTTLRAAVIGAIDRPRIAEGLIRDHGRSLGTKAPEPRAASAELTFATAAGDELLELMQRVIQKDLGSRNIEAELATIDPATFYGAWEARPPVDVLLKREIVPGFNGPRVPGDLRWFPLFSVDTVIGLSRDVHGPEEVNGSLDGPLWNAHEWWTE